MSKHKTNTTFYAVIDEIRTKLEELEARTSSDYLQRIEEKNNRLIEENVYLHDYATELEFILEAVGLNLNRTYLQWELDAMQKAIEEALR